MRLLRGALFVASAAAGSAVLDYYFHGSDSQVVRLKESLQRIIDQEPSDDVVFIPSTDARAVEEWLRTHEQVFSRRHLAAVGRTRSILRRTKADNLTENRVRKWRLVLICWQNYMELRGAKLPHQINKGVPSAVRGLLWLKLASSFPLPSDLVTSYHELLDQETPFASLIDRDVPRTFTAHEFFAAEDSPGQAAMRRVLRVFSLYDPTVGYCQGMNFIAALLLLFVTEVEAFCLLVALMTKYRMHQMFVEGLPRLHVLNFAFSQLMKERLPRLHAHFEQEQVPLSVLTTPWFVTNFLCYLPLDASVTIWDHFMHRGQEVVLSYAIALLKACENDLLSLNLEGVLLYLQELPQAYPTAAHLPAIDTDKSVEVDTTTLENLERRYLVYRRVATGSPVSPLMQDDGATKQFKHTRSHSSFGGGQTVPSLASSTSSGSSRSPRGPQPSSPLRDSRGRRYSK